MANSKETDKDKLGRPEFEITDAVLKKVESFASRCLNNQEMAAALGISESTFYDKKKEFSEFSEAVEGGRAKGTGVIKNKFFEKAKTGDNQCMIMILKNYSDLKDKQEIKHEGGIIQPLNLTKEQFKELRQEMLTQDDC